MRRWRLAKLVGPIRLVVRVDESAEAIGVVEKRSTVASQCHWTRSVTADLNTFLSHQRFDIVVARCAPRLQGDDLTRLSRYLTRNGVIIITGKPTGSTDNRSAKWQRRQDR